MNDFETTSLLAITGFLLTTVIASLLFMPILGVAVTKEVIIVWVICSGVSYLGILLEIVATRVASIVGRISCTAKKRL